MSSLRLECNQFLITNTFLTIVRLFAVRKKRPKLTFHPVGIRCLENFDHKQDRIFDDGASFSYQTWSVQTKQKEKKNLSQQHSSEPTNEEQKSPRWKNMADKKRVALQRNRNEN